MDNYDIDSGFYRSTYDWLFLYGNGKGGGAGSWSGNGFGDGLFQGDANGNGEDGCESIRYNLENIDESIRKSSNG
jgi:hypothetical protein